MRRGVFDTLRRGLDNAVANWGLIVVRVVEVVTFAAISIAVALAALVPLLISIGIAVNDVRSLDDVEEFVLSLGEQWTWLLWILLGISVLMLVFVAMHAFVEAGCTRVAVDADRAAGPVTEGPRSRYRVFSLQRWFGGGKAGWWTVFWIYNLAWSVAGLILLIPLLPTLVVSLVVRDNPPVQIASSCIGLALTFMLFILVGIVTSMWTTRATANWALDGTGATASLSNAWTALKADVGRHLLIALAVVVIALAGSSFFASFSYFAAFGEMFHRATVTQLFTIPLRLLGTLCNWIFSAFVSSWYLGAYAALAVERTTKPL
jgi:hypothetical protein